jgi:hypothetical protein
MQLASALLVAAILVGADGKEEPLKPPFAPIDLDRGESQEVRLPDGARAKVKLVDVEETRDSLRSALRRARVKVEINGSTSRTRGASTRTPGCGCGRRSRRG